MARFCSILIAFFLSFVSINAMANVKIIFATVPADREVVMPPRGYANCQTVVSGFYDGIWMNKHKVCQYSRHRGMWISGYWQCSKVKKGFCTKWDWAPSRWEGAPVAVYAPHRPVAYPTPAVAYAPAPVRPALPAIAPQPQPMPAPVVGAPQPAPSPVVVGPQPMPSPVVG